MWLTALPALLIFAKLWSLQLDPVKHQHFRVRAENSSLISIPPVRGAIYDRNGEVLAENQSGFDLHFVYSELNPRYIVFEVVCEELGRLGGFPKVAEARALLRQLVDIDRLEALLSQGKPFEPEWLRVVDRIPPEVAERITRRLSPRKIFQDNFELRPASAAGEQDHFELWLRPEKLFRLELTLRRLAARIDEYSLEDLEGRLDAGLVDVDDFDEEREGWSAEQVWDEMSALLPFAPDPVVTHGDISLDNILIADGGHVGCIDAGRAGIADRYQDLAIVWHGLAEFGRPLQERFFATYGIDQPDERKISFHLMLDEFF